MVKTETQWINNQERTSWRLWLLEATEVFLRLEYADPEIQCKEKLGPPHARCLYAIFIHSNYFRIDFLLPRLQHGCESQDSRRGGTGRH